MKILLSWVLKHLQYNKEITIQLAQTIQQKLSVHTAEIERLIHIQTESSQFSAAQITHIFTDTIEVYSPEWQRKYTLPLRDNCIVNDWAIIHYDYKTDKTNWASMQEFGSSSDSFLPIIANNNHSLSSGEWKKDISWEDFVLEIDNAAVSHRPDLWGHQGWAREIAAILSIPFFEKQYQQSLPQNTIEYYFSNTPSTQKYIHATCSDEFCMQLDKQVPCKRIVSSMIKTKNAGASRIYYTIQLARIDARSKNALIDATNYVMYDTGIPMHGFDYKAIKGNTITLRMAKNNETVELLDTAKITLTEHDSIFADQEGPLSLAGVMGGSRASLQNTTDTIIVEATSYQASTIRKTAIRHKHRTEASTRFEKSTDPLGCDRAIGCFFDIITAMGISIHQSPTTIILGSEPIKTTRTISLSHDIIEQKMGCTINPDHIQKILQSLGFAVTKKQNIYTVTIPSFRVEKDIAIPEDIIEEIARIYGYDQIIPSLPMIQMVPHDISLLQRIRTIKQTAAQCCGLYELYSPALYDEKFLQHIDFDPINPISITNPLSDNAKRLATSLIPHLLKACQLNSIHTEKIGFFEIQKTWEYLTKTESTERDILALCAAAINTESSFYAGKDIVTHIFDSVDATLQWIRYDQYPDQSKIPEWICSIIKGLLSTNQVALLLVNNEIVGYAGMVRFDKMQRLFEGTIFVCECEYKKIISTTKTICYKPLSKYQHAFLDISMLAPYALTVDAIEQIIQSSDNRITDTFLIDYFTKAEWIDQRSVTLRTRIQDSTKAVDKETIEEVMNAMKLAIEYHGAIVR